MKSPRGGIGERVSERSDPMGAWVLVVFAVVAAMFFSATLWSQRRADSIDGAADSIATNAAPSIETLAISRGELRKFEFVLAAATQTPATLEPSESADIDREREELHQALAQYLRVPTYPGERALWANVRDGLAMLDTLVARVRRSALGTAVPPTEADVRDAFDRLDDSLERVIAFNAEHAHVLAARIEGVRRAEGHTALWLDGLSAGLTFVMAVILVLFIRRSQLEVAAHRQEAERRANELDAFAGRVAHDVKGPVSAALMWLETMRARADDVSAAAPPDSMRRIDASLRRAVDLVDALLAFARSGAQPDRTRVAIVAAAFEEIRDELDPIARAANVDLVVEPVDPSLAVSCAPTVLADVLGNLARNAIKFMGEGAARRVVLRGTERGAFVRIEVQDTGPGMTAETAAKCFEPFQRGAGVTQPGSGLGLATVRRLVQSHCGDVHLFTREGDGTTFVIDLPASPQAPLTRRRGETEHARRT